MTGVRRRSLALVLAGVAVAVAAETVAYGLDDPRHWIPDAFAGLSLVVGGAVIWARRPGWRTGPLLAAAGFAWFLGNLEGASTEWISSAASHLLFLYVGVLVQVALSYPSGRFRAPLQAVATAGGYAAALTPDIWRSPWAICAVAALLIAVAFRLYTTARGQARRLAFAALQASLGLAGILLLVAALHLLGASRSTALLMLQIALASYSAALTAGALREPWRQDAVTDFVVTLADDRSGTLRGELARILGDPTLRIGYWDAEGHRFVDASGVEVQVPPTATVVEHAGEPIAAVMHEPGVMDDPQLLAAVAAATELASEYARLQSMVESQIDEIAASQRRLLRAADDERERLGRLLRDTAERRLTELDSALAEARQQTSDATLAEEIAEARRQLERTRDDLHRLALGLYPRPLAEGGLASALALLAEESPVPVRVAASSARLPEELEATLYFICSEALANAAKHAAATAVEVTFSVERDLAQLQVIDNGVGGANADGSGLRGLVDRAEAFGGALHVQSPPGEGTQLVVVLPTGGA